MFSRVVRRRSCSLESSKGMAIGTQGFDGPGTKQYFGRKPGTYHWDDELGPDGRVLGHGTGNADGDFPHLQIHTFDGPVIRIFWGG